MLELEIKCMESNYFIPGDDSLTIIKGVSFSVKKLWCCVGGSITELIIVNRPPNLFRISLWWPIYIINSVDKTKLSHTIALTLFVNKVSFFIKTLCDKTIRDRRQHVIIKSLNLVFLCELLIVLNTCFSLDYSLNR